MERVTEGKMEGCDCAIGTFAAVEALVEDREEEFARDGHKGFMEEPSFTSFTW